MENRELVAFGLLAIVLGIALWVAYRKISAKRAFEYRQSGRGKHADDE
jgi:hypothetical protein